MALLTGCAADTSEEEVETSVETNDAVIGGAVTREAPEVGMASFSWGSYCTATLVSPRVAITAAHCVRYATRDASGSFGSLRIDKEPTGTARYPIDRYRSFARSGLGAVDVALLRLKTPVPADVARPAPLATAKPANGTALTIYGYGCNDDWEHQTGGGTKREIGYRFGTTIRNTLCPGDSGGPVRVDASGAVLLINSGWVSDWTGKRDVFGDVPAFLAQIRAQERAWEAAEPADGLLAEYWDTKELTGEPKVTRVDPAIDFDWGSGSPDSIIERDSFAARWSGKLTAPTSETYTLEVRGDDGFRLYVDGAIVIDEWRDHSPTTRSARVAFTAGQPRAIKLEYYESTGGATARLSWSSPSQAKQVVPRSRFTR
ncbi:MAG: trypsin-like serine protease [Labilithrix sp.]|nr:trypsin-like serine protease [Labilithrix sp.]MCW5814614.1 trypsin-like serine protease [Labilithrix sp.]